LFTAFQKGFNPFVGTVCFLTYSITGTYLKYILDVKIQLFVTLKSYQDPNLDPDPRGFTVITHLKYILHVKVQLFVTLKSYQDPNLDLDPYWFGSLDPDRHQDKKLYLEPDPH
jgi:hypothetical protein